MDKEVEQLQVMFDRATNPSNSVDADLIAIQTFALIVKNSSSETINAATKLISGKLFSARDDEVIQSLEVLEACMAECGPEFHSAVGKFRFLNELIKLVSPKYLGKKTSPDIRNKVLDLFLIWSIQYPQESKIKEAYDMLLKQGVSHESCKAVVVDQTAKANNSIGSNNSNVNTGFEVTFKKLLQSDNATDRRAANLLIRNKVREDERRDEIKLRKKIELGNIRANVDLLDEMLNQYDPKETTSEELMTMNQLYETCKQLQPIVVQFSKLDDDDPATIYEILESNDHLLRIFNRYQALVIEKKDPSTYRDQSINLIDPLVNLSLNPVKNVQPTQPSQSDRLLEDIFSDVGPSTASSQPEGDLLSSGDELLLFPVNSESIRSTDTTNIECIQPTKFDYKDLMIGTTTGNNIQQIFPSTKPLTQSTPTSIRHAQLDPAIENLIMNLKEEMVTNNQTLTSIDVEPIDRFPDSFSIQTTDQSNKIQEIEIIEEKFELNDLKQSQPNVPLSQIAIDLNTIRPAKEPSRIVWDEPEGLKIILNFTLDRPRSDVIVLVFTTINQSTSPINNFQLDATIARPSKLHFLPATGTELSGIKPFRPPSDDITQICLVSNPTELSHFDIICSVSYCLNGDPDPIKESIPISKLPFIYE